MFNFNFKPMFIYSLIFALALSLSTSDDLLKTKTPFIPSSETEQVDR